MLRLLHIVVLAGLVLAAADVYKIKYESTLQAKRSQSCAPSCAASRTRSRTCAPNGASSTGPTASRNWRAAISR